MLPLSPELDALITPAPAAALPTVDLDQVGLIGVVPPLFTLSSLSPVFICLSFSSILPTLAPMRWEGVHRRVAPAVGERIPAAPVPPAAPPVAVAFLANAIVRDMDCVLARYRSWYPNVPVVEDAREGAALESFRSILRPTTLGLKCVEMRFVQEVVKAE